MRAAEALPANCEAAARVSDLAGLAADQNGVCAHIDPGGLFAQAKDDEPVMSRSAAYPATAYGGPFAYCHLAGGAVPLD